MNEKIIMLGTGSAMVTDCYNTCFLLKSENDCLLVDAGGGNGILSAIKKSGIAWNSIKTMFITHSHTDHIFRCRMGNKANKRSYEFRQI